MHKKIQNQVQCDALNGAFIIRKTVQKAVVRYQCLIVSFPA